MFITRIITLFALTISSTAFAFAAKRTIVGVWRPASATQCTTFQGAMRVGPMFLGGDDFKCDFNAVSREGDTVSWKGSCGFPEPPKPTVVIARLRGERLTLQFDIHKEGESYVRCKGDKFEQ